MSAGRFGDELRQGNHLGVIGRQGRVQLADGRQARRLHQNIYSPIIQMQQTIAHTLLICLQITAILTVLGAVVRAAAATSISSFEARVRGSCGAAGDGCGATLSPGGPGGRAMMRAAGWAGTRVPMRLGACVLGEGPAGGGAETEAGRSRE